jgi:hypothetical protein
MTRGDLSTYLVVLCSGLGRATTTHLEYGYHLLGYLVQSKGLTLKIDASDIRVPMGMDKVEPEFYLSLGLHTYSDSSWGKSPKPIGGYIIFMCGCPVDWQAKMLKVVADSTCEAETAIGSRATKATIFVRGTAVFIGVPISQPTPLLIDNEAMLKMCSKHGATSRTRYFDRATALVKDAAQKLIVSLHLVPTDLEVADIFTKAVDMATLLRLRAYVFGATLKLEGAQLVHKATKMVAKLRSILSSL